MNEAALQEAIANPQNIGEMADADAVGTVGSPDCGDMLRLWLKFSEVDGKKIIDRASFQSFGCQTALAVASMATELLKGKTIEQAQNLSAAELGAPLGPLPPMKIHCGQMVEGALRAALNASSQDTAPTPATPTPPAQPSGNLAESLVAAPTTAGRIKISLLPHS
jgi:nitrogen fixation NifU-like protein